MSKYSANGEVVRSLFMGSFLSKHHKVLATNPKCSEKTLVRQRKAMRLASLEAEPRVKILWFLVLVAPSRQGGCFSAGMAG